MKREGGGREGGVEGVGGRARLLLRALRRKALPPGDHAAGGRPPPRPLPPARHHRLALGIHLARQRPRAVREHLQPKSRNYLGEVDFRPVRGAGAIQHDISVGARITTLQVNLCRGFAICKRTLLDASSPASCQSI